MNSFLKCCASIESLNKIVWYQDAFNIFILVSNGIPWKLFHLCKSNDETNYEFTINGLDISGHAKITRHENLAYDENNK